MPTSSIQRADLQPPQMVDQEADVVKRFIQMVQANDPGVWDLLDAAGIGPFDAFPFDPLSSYALRHDDIHPSDENPDEEQWLQLEGLEDDIPASSHWGQTWVRPRGQPEPSNSHWGQTWVRPRGQPEPSNLWGYAAVAMADCEDWVKTYVGKKQENGKAFVVKLLLNDGCNLSGILDTQDPTVLLKTWDTLVTILDTAHGPWPESTAALNDLLTADAFPRVTPSPAHAWVARAFLNHVLNLGMYGLWAIPVITNHMGSALLWDHLVEKDEWDFNGLGCSIPAVMEACAIDSLELAFAMLENGANPQAHVVFDWDVHEDKDFSWDDSESVWDDENLDEVQANGMAISTEEAPVLSGRPCLSLSAIAWRTTQISLDRMLFDPFQWQHLWSYCIESIVFLLRSGADFGSPALHVLSQHHEFPTTTNTFPIVSSQSVSTAIEQWFERLPIESWNGSPIDDLLHALKQTHEDVMLRKALHSVMDMPSLSDRSRPRL